MSNTSPMISDDRFANYIPGMNVARNLHGKFACWDSPIKRTAIETGTCQQILDANDRAFWKDFALKYDAKRSRKNLQPLKNLCFQEIYLMSARGHVTALGHLANAMKDEMLEYLKANELRVCYQLAKQLLHAESTWMDFGLVKRGEDQLKVWSHLISSCPLISTVVWRDYHGKPYTLLPIADITKLPQLNHIEMPDFWCDSHALRLLAEHYSDKLRVLHVSLLKLETEELGMLQMLRNLRVLDFHGSRLRRSDVQRDMERMADLLIALPCLEVLWPSYPESCEHSSALNLLYSINQSVFVSLKQLRIQDSLNYWPVMVTEVEKLFIQGHPTEETIKFVKSLNKLRSLNVKTSSVSCQKWLVKMLQCVGPQLTELVIEVAEAEYDVRLYLCQIMILCPRLEKLHIIGRVSLAQSENLFVSANHLKKLKVVKIDLTGAFVKSKLLNSIVALSDNLEVLRIGPLSLLKEIGFIEKMLFRACNNPKGFERLRELWVTLGHPQVAAEFCQVLKRVAFCAPQLDKIYINTLSSEGSVYFNQLKLFIQHFMPHIDLLVY